MVRFGLAGMFVFLALLKYGKRPGSLDAENYTYRGTRRLKIDLKLNKEQKAPLFVDLFAGAGGLSEGFVRAGYRPVAHVEEDMAAAYSLRTRDVFHKLKGSGDLETYDGYLTGNITRDQFYESARHFGPNSTINAVICTENLPSIFASIDKLLDGRRADIIIGGPPCQAYSLVGRARSERCMIGDLRNYLFVHYAEFLKRYRPKFFVFENVVGLLSARDERGERYLDKMLTLFEEVGYKVEHQTLSSEQFGVLQKRKRVILIGRRGRKTGFFPNIRRSVSDAVVRDAIGDLPSLRAGEGDPRATRLTKKSSSWLVDAGILSWNRKVTWHQARPHNQRDLEIYSEAIRQWDELGIRLDYNALKDDLKTHKNRRSFLDRFKVVAADLPASHTIVAHLSKDGNYYIHPDQRQNRSLTPREAARLQSFPDDYYFESASGTPSRTAAFKQIGNAVPVLLAQRIAEAILENWE